MYFLQIFRCFAFLERFDRDNWTWLLAGPRHLAECSWNGTEPGTNGFRQRLSITRIVGFIFVQAMEESR
jgi:hypothetical protein